MERSGFGLGAELRFGMGWNEGACCSSGRGGGIGEIGGWRDFVARTKKVKVYGTRGLHPKSLKRVKRVFIPPVRAKPTCQNAYSVFKGLPECLTLLQSQSCSKQSTTSTCLLAATH